MKDAQLIYDTGPRISIALSENIIRDVGVRE